MWRLSSQRSDRNMHVIRCLWFRPWWRHQIETFSVLLAICAGNSPVTGEFPSQRPVTRSFDIFFDRRLNKRVGMVIWGAVPSCPVWRHCNAKATSPQRLSTGLENAQVFSHGRQWPNYLTWQMIWLTMTWQHKKPGPTALRSTTGITWPRVVIFVDI